MLSLFFLGPGCASLKDGNKQTVYIETQVEEAEVYLDKKFMGETPVSIDLPRQKNLILEIRKKNYQTRKVKLKVGTSGYFWLNLPFTVLGVTGVSTDYGTGSMYEYDPDSYIIELKPLPGAKVSGPSFRQELFKKINQRRLATEKARHQRGELLSALEALEKREQVSK